MSRTIGKISFPLPEGSHFHEMIDVRAPVEFAEDHVTGAINLPVLNDEERCLVGTIYKQSSPFDARKIGASLVSKNIAAHLDSYFSTKARDYRPLLYCWRGGQRSGSMATVLNDIGWATTVVDGGYRSYRSHVIETIRRKSEELSLIVLNGFTGSGKTLILKSLEKSGQQVLDLEAMASHKGSVFGGDPENPQPAQKRFESLLFDRIASFDPTRPVFVEAESSKIGKLNLPNPLWQHMKKAPVVEICSPLESRAAYLTADYREWLSDPGRVKRTIDRFKGFHSDRILTEWKLMSERGEWEELVTLLLSEHYDRRYSIGGSGSFESPSFTLPLPAHDPASVERCAAELVEKSTSLFAPAVVS